MKKTASGSGIQRRSVLLGGAALGASLAMPGIVRSANQQSVFSGWGGSWEAAMRKAWFDPFTKKTGIEVKTVSGNSFGKLEAMVKAGSTEWDVFETLSQFQWIGGDKGLFEPIDFSVVDKSQILPGDDFVTKFSVPQVLYSDILVYNNKLSPPPTTWADLYDTARFPGTRTFDNTQIQDVIESALLADGVAPANLYPLDVPRALKKMSSIRDKILFYDTNAQGEQFLRSGQCSMGVLPDGRAMNVRDNGGPVTLQYNTCIISWTTMVIPKGAPNAAAAQKFLGYILTPEAQAAISMAYPYGPVNPKALDLIPAERANMLAGGPQTKGKAVVRNEKWWATNFDATTEKFNAWKLG
jgi:putative spermidine/putrescine transport system substrate-binding protein